MDGSSILTSHYPSLGGLQRQAQSKCNVKESYEMLNMILNMTWLLPTSTTKTCGCLQKMKPDKFLAQVGRGPQDCPTLEELLAADVEEGRFTLL